MKYRGVEYQPVTTTLDVVEGDVVARYRGQAYRQTYVKHLPEAGPAFQLRYRGASYTTGTVPIAPIPDSEIQELKPTSTIVPLRRVVADQLSQAHHQNLIRNLEHRLEVARSQGNSKLIQMLESEWERI
jgi:hypothetical protein